MSPEATLVEVARVNAYANATVIIGKAALKYPEGEVTEVLDELFDVFAKLAMSGEEK